MTGGIVVVLGSVGKNFAAGMSGGVAYVYDKYGNFEKNCNTELVFIEKVDCKQDKQQLKNLILNHKQYTNSNTANSIILNWEKELKKFVKIIPKVYKKMINEIENFKNQGLDNNDAIMAAFEKLNK